MPGGGLLTGTGDWQLDANWSFLTKPIVNEEAAVPASMGNDITDPAGAAIGIDLNRLSTHPGFTEKFGADGASIQTIADLVHFMSAGPVYFEADDVTLTCDELRIEMANAGVPVFIGSNPVDKGAFLHSHISRGDVSMQGTIKFAAAAHVMLGSMENQSDAKLRIAHGTDATLADFIQSAGESFIDNIVTRLSIANSICTKGQQKAGIIDVFEGGRLIYNHAAVAADVTMARVHTGGILDLTQNGFLKVLDLVIVARGGELKKINALHTITDLRYLEVEG